MKESLTSSTAKMAITMMVACALIIFSAVGVYAVYLGPSAGYRISNTDSSAWANFGTYFGGVLGPIFGFLAFMGVLFTLVLQARQLDVAQKQAGLEEFQRNLSSCAAALDAILGRRVTYLQVFRRVDIELSIRDVLSKGGTATLAKAKDNFEKARFDEAIEASKSTVQGEFSELFSELDHLVWCLEAYRDEGGREKVLGLYHRKYQPIVIWLDALGFVAKGGNVDNYFEPQKNRHFLMS